MNIITQQKRIVNGNDGKELKMTLAQKKWIIILAIAVVAFLLGRLAVRAFMNLLDSVYMRSSQNSQPNSDTSDVNSRKER